MDSSCLDVLRATAQRSFHKVITFQMPWNAWLCVLKHTVFQYVLKSCISFLFPLFQLHSPSFCLLPSSVSLFLASLWCSSINIQLVLSYDIDLWVPDKNIFTGWMVLLSLAANSMQMQKVCWKWLYKMECLSILVLFFNADENLKACVSYN